MSRGRAWALGVTRKVALKSTRAPLPRHNDSTIGTGHEGIFVTDGVQSALEQARAAAGNRDVRVSGGANLIQQFIKAGLVDELRIHLAPILLGKGVRLFDHIAAEDVTLETVEVIDSPLVMHLAFRITK